MVLIQVEITVKNRTIEHGGTFHYGFCWVLSDLTEFSVFSERKLACEQLILCKIFGKIFHQRLLKEVELEYKRRDPYACKN